MTDQLITTTDAATLLGLDRRTVSARVRHGTLAPVMKLPGERGAYLFDRDEIKRLAEQETAQ